MQSGPVPVLIPAYRPGDELVGVVRELTARGVDGIVVVNDGSGPGFEPVFETVAAVRGVHVVHHAVNLGKGTALKTGLNHALVRYPECRGVVTADADGQHLPADIVRVAEELRNGGESLVLGVRTFDERAPRRSRVGNHLACLTVRLLVGQKLTDTQTGLRGIPAPLIPHLLRLRSPGYEFELDMLLACKHQGVRVTEVPIETVYLDDNRGSHFHPVADSMRVAFVLARFTVLSLLTAAVDNAVFAMAYAAWGGVGPAQVAGRLVAMTFNYAGARSYVFQSRQRHAVVFTKYAALVAANGLVSYGLITWLHQGAGMGAIAAKLLAEGLLWAASFAIQRDFVFTRPRQAGVNTDWDRYYERVPVTARLTRRYSTGVLLKMMRRHVRAERPAVVEIGGANSCFLDAVRERTRSRSYDVVDTNRYGLALLRRRLGGVETVRLHEQDVRAMTLRGEADVVFSVGLVEHFNADDTRRALRAHFDAAREGGIVMVTFPTPTRLYRASRRALELARLWRFPDERPLRPEEVRPLMEEWGKVLEEKTLWPLVLTQHLVVARKGRG